MLRHILRDNRGSAFVELALVLPLLAFVIIGAAELGRIAYFSIELANAARAGAAYGTQSSTFAANANIANIKLAATEDAPDIAITFPTTPGTGNYCVCETVNSTAGSISDTTPELCNTPAVQSATYCTESTTVGVTNTVIGYVQVATQATVKTMFHYPGIPTSFTLNGYAMMRVM